LAQELKLTTGCKKLDILIFRKPSMWVLYGPAASGKTNLALYLLKLNPIHALYISTEGSVYMERVMQIAPLNATVNFINVLTLEEQFLNLVKALTLAWDLIIVDSINAFFRAEIMEKKYSVIAFNTMLASLRKISERGTYVLLTAQVRAGEEEEEPSGLKYLRFWCNGLLKLERAKNSIRSIYLIKDKEEIPVGSFKIVREGIRWIEC